MSATISAGRGDIMRVMIMRMARAPLLFCTLLLLSVVAHGQPERVRFQHFSVEQGLSQNYVYSIFQDSKGYMWFGTRDGLNKYDGYIFTHHKHQPFSKGAIPANVIRSVREDHEGNLWIGTFRGGLVRFDRKQGSFSSYRRDTKKGSLADDDISVLHIDHRGNLWVGSFNGALHRMIPSLHDRLREGESYSFVPYNIEYSRSPGMKPVVSSIREDRSGNLWIGTTGGFCRYDRERDRVVQVPGQVVRSRELTSHVQDIVVDNLGRIWIGSFGGLQLYDRAGNTFVDIDTSHVYDRLAIDSSGVIWGGHRNGLSAYDPKRGSWVHYRFGWDSPSDVRGTVILALYIDPSGGIWIGTDGGISKVDYRFSRFRATTRDSSELSSISGIRSIIEDREGVIWMGTTGRGVISLDRAGMRSRRHTAHHSRNIDYINTLLEDRSGMLWIGTRVGLATLDKGVPVTHHYPGVVPDWVQGNVWALCEDRFGILWVGTTSGLIRYDRSAGNVRVFQHNPNDATTISYSGVWKIVEDRRGDLWIGTPGGLNRFDRKSETFTRYRHNPADPGSLAHNEVWTIYEDRLGRFWVGTWGGGLSLLDRATGRFINYTEAKGLGSNTIHGILEDELGNLWISHGSGISKFDPMSGIFINYGLADGLRFNEYNPNSCCRARDGLMLFGGLYGVTSFDPKDVGPMSLYSPPIVVTSFKKLDKVFATELLDGAEVEIAHNENYCSFEFAALDYGIPGRNRYAYKLEGFDRDWVYSGTRRYVSYTNLDPGEYLFHVKATNSDGVWNEEGIAIRVRVIPPFWERSIFQVLVVMGLAAIGLVWYRQRARRRRELEIALDEAREIERRGIAAELHDGPLQDLYSVRFVLEPLAGSVGNGAAGSQVAKIDETLRRVRGSLRSVCGDLQLPSFDCGLDVAIDVHAERIRESSPHLDLRLDLTADEDRLSHDIRRNLFRVYRSAMSNVIKHADATEATVRLAIDSRHVLLEVSDNGRGFVPPRNLNELLRRQHYGLLLIDAHARGIGVRPEILSEPGKGTTIRVRIELQAKRPGKLAEGVRNILHHTNGTERKGTR